MSLAAYSDWLTEDLLPFWLGRSRCPATGLFHEKLRLDGAPDTTAPLRLRTMFRQVYTFSHAARMGVLPREEALGAARGGITALIRHAFSPDDRPGWVAVLNPDGSVKSPRRDLYDHAFVLLGLAWYVEATADPVGLELIDATLETIDTVLAAPHGGFAEDDLGTLPRRQNPHMHLFEAMMALAETRGRPSDLARAKALFDLFLSRFFDGARGLVVEFFAADWSLLPGEESDRFEPGHLCEWVWLLRRYERLTGTPVAAECAALLHQAETLGLGADGFLVDEVDATGTPRLDRRRLWTQTEYLKALIEEAQARRAPDLVARADALAARILATYGADSIPGGWIDQYDLQGHPTADHIPASILYHLFAVLPEIRRLGRG